MRGTVIKRGRSWSVVLDLGADESGKRIRKWHSGFGTKKEAEHARIDLLNQVQTGTYVAPSKQTLGDFLEEWIPSVSTTIRPSTLFSYERNLRRHVIPHIGGRKLIVIDAGVLNGLYADLLRNGKGSEGLSPRTVHYIHTILHRAFSDAVRWNRLVRNPAAAATPPKPKSAAQPPMRTWTAGELKSFLDVTKTEDDRLHAVWFLLAMTGMRRGEVLGLRWSDVDLVQKRLSISQTLIRYGNTVAFGTPKTSKGRRSVSLDGSTVNVLKAHKRAQNTEQLLIGKRYEDLDLVFPTVGGGPFHPDRVSEAFDRRVAKYKLPRIRLHDLRHTWATLALQTGVHVKVVSERLGHSGIAITLDTYSHVLPEIQSEAAEKVANEILRRRT